MLHAAVKDRETIQFKRDADVVVDDDDAAAAIRQTCRLRTILSWILSTFMLDAYN